MSETSNAQCCVTSPLGRHWLHRLVRQLGGDSKLFYGWPLSWFEPCGYLDADGVVDKDGKLGNADHGGFHAAFRMRDEKRQKAGWSLPNAEVSEGGTRDSRIETAAQSRPSLH